MPEKFYKVFVSSTYEDLMEERQEVFDALLKCNCFPVGMEHFPSSNRKSLDLIKAYIDQCDYFVLVSAGTYGSLVPEQPTKIGFVEWEYEYAKTILPCYSFVIKDADQLPHWKCEKTNPDLLEAFHKKLKGGGRNIAFYTSATDLKNEVQHAFTKAPTDAPAIGWIRADSTSNAGELIGAWELEWSNVVKWQQCRIVKLFSSTEFIWIQFDQKGILGFICGYYDRDTYSLHSIREIPYESSFPAIKGKLQEYLIQIDGDVLTTEGTRSTGGQIKEVFRRVDWPERARSLSQT